MLNEKQIGELRKYLDRRNELLGVPKHEAVSWTDDDLSTRTGTYSQIEKLGGGCPEKAAVAFARGMIGEHVQRLMTTCETSNQIH